MDAATKHLLLQQEFGSIHPNVKSELLVPAGQALSFLQQLAALDISLIYSITLGERQLDQTFSWTQIEDLHDDRTLGLSQAANFVQKYQATNLVMVFAYDVFDDIPFNERATILREKPSIAAQVSVEGRVNVESLQSIQPISDLVWHHVQLQQASLEGGGTLDLTDVPGRFEQLAQAMAWTRTILTESPEAKFSVRGVLRTYDTDSD